MIPVSRPYFGADEEAAVVAALRSGWVTQGPRVAEFERAFAAALGQPEAIAVSSCTRSVFRPTSPPSGGWRARRA